MRRCTCDGAHELVHKSGDKPTGLDGLDTEDLSKTCVVEFALPSQKDFHVP